VEKSVSVIKLRHTNAKKDFAKIVIRRKTAKHGEQRKLTSILLLGGIVNLRLHFATRPLFRPIQIKLV